ncbi:death ligand signal enhancer isoform X2 [Mauremys reevesii]|uniref:death ligand signal enhancer isoform X2 n=1 Tax=Mauremys reevesii TaxID=260615 RepID=UPI00193ED55D|nr:death ligand signal enhancer isoform X2 [Mauremys reevesii]
MVYGPSSLLFMVSGVFYLSCTLSGVSHLAFTLPLYGLVCLPLGLTFLLHGFCGAPLPLTFPLCGLSRGAVWEPGRGSEMWRLPGLLSRALHRLHVLNASSSIHGIPTLPTNEEFRNATSAISVGQTPSEQSYFLSPGWQSRWGRDGWEQGNAQRPFLNLQPHYTVLDAFTWGALAVLVLQLARQIPWLSPVPGAGREDGHPRVGGFLSSLLPHQHSVPAAGSSSCHSNQKVPCFLLEGIPDAAPENPSSGIPSGQGKHQLCPETEEHSFPESCSTSLGPAHCSVQGLSFSTLQGKPAQQERLEEAATQLQQVFRVSVSIALNILGIEKVSDGHYRAAYSCFRLAADRGYSKAQFNVGLCYEHGRGTEKDLAKAALYYHRAASNGHLMAQYRYARFLLRHGLKAERADMQKAVTLLEQAAAAGLVEKKLANKDTSPFQLPSRDPRQQSAQRQPEGKGQVSLPEAQAYLGVLYMKGLQSAKQRALKYLWLAAKNGDSQSRYHVGVCYEKGLGVQQNFTEAMEHYQHSAAAGNRHAQERVQVVEQEMAVAESSHPAPSGMRAFSSSPCLWVLEQLAEQRQAPPMGCRALPLPHAWSTGSLAGADVS